MKLTKLKLKELIEEAASEYVWGVKGPGRVANQYDLRTFKTSKHKLKKIIKEELLKLYEQEVPDPYGWGENNPLNWLNIVPGMFRRPSESDWAATRELGGDERSRAFRDLGARERLYSLLRPMQIGEYGDPPVQYDRNLGPAGYNVDSIGPPYGHVQTPYSPEDAESAAFFWGPEAVARAAELSGMNLVDYGGDLRAVAAGDTPARPIPGREELLNRARELNQRFTPNEYPDPGFGAPFSGYPGVHAVAPPIPEEVPTDSPGPSGPSLAPAPADSPISPEGAPTAPCRWENDPRLSPGAIRYFCDLDRQGGQ